MKTVIVVYSKTGNTLEVSERVKAELSDKGHDVTLLNVIAENDDPNSKGVLKLIETPSVKSFENVIFAGHIQAFSLAPAMKKYLEQLEDLSGKKVLCLLTQYFPYSWMGGNRGMRQMTTIIESKNCVVGAKGIVHWSRKKKEEEIVNIVKEFGDFEF